MGGIKLKLLSSVFLATAFVSGRATAAVTYYGTPDLEGYGYPGNADPTVGANPQGLAPDAVTLATTAYGHPFPFAPAAGDYPGTHQIYVGSNQTADRDGYSGYSGRIAGPQVVTMNYASMVPAGSAVTTLTLGIGADDFQFPAWGDPFTAAVNGVVDPAISNQLMALNQTGPYEQYFSIGIDPASLLPSGVLTLSINEGGDGGDGWAVDFFTIGVTTAPVPEPVTAALIAFGGLLMTSRRRSNDRGQS